MTKKSVAYFPHEDLCAANCVVMNRSFRTRSLQEYEEQLKMADSLIDEIQKEYQFE